jgi:hypothetical protein
MNRGAALGSFLYLKEVESPWLAAPSVLDDLHGFDLPEGLKGLSQVIFDELVG